MRYMMCSWRWGLRGKSVAVHISVNGEREIPCTGLGMAKLSRGNNLGQLCLLLTTCAFLPDFRLVNRVQDLSKHLQRQRALQ